MATLEPEIHKHSKYHHSHDERAYAFCKDTLATDIQLADYFGVHRKTIANWEKEFPSFRKAIADGRKEFWNF